MQFDKIVREAHTTYETCRDRHQALSLQKDYRILSDQTPLSRPARSQNVVYSSANREEIRDERKIRRETLLYYKRFSWET